MVDQLREKYPVGNDLRWPQDRVFTLNKRSWKLNDVRLRVWATHIVRKQYIYHLHRHRIE